MSARLLDVFFSRCAPGHDNGPKKKHFDAARRHIETNGYRCGDLVQVYGNGDMSVRPGGDGEKEEPVLFCREANLCGAAVEAQYYIRARGQNGAREQGPNKTCLLSLLC